MTTCHICGEAIFRDEIGVWRVADDSPSLFLYECKPEGYNHEYGSLFHAPA